MFDPRRNTRPNLSSQGRRFFLILIALGFVGAFIRDHLGISFGPVGGFFWVISFFLTFAVWLIYYAIYILPTGIRNWYEEGFWLIWRHYFHERRRYTSTTNLDGVPSAVSRFGAGILDSHLVLGISRSRSFSRAAGPGFVQLSPGEYIRQVIDLRRHFREIRVNGVTRDGIPFETTVGVSFGVRRLTQADQPRMTPYPTDPEAIFQASYFGTVEEGEVEVAWKDRVAPIVGSALVAELSTYTLDSIYQVGVDGGRPIRAGNSPIRFLMRIETGLLRDIQKRLIDYGIQLYEIQIGDLKLPENVRQQHILNLQSLWQTQTVSAIQTLSDEEIQANAVIDLIRYVVNQAQLRHQVSQERMSDVITGVIVEIARTAAETGRIEIGVGSGLNEPANDNQHGVERLDGDDVSDPAEETDG